MSTYQKGDRVAVVGMLKTEAWTNNEGKHQQSTQIEAKSVAADPIFTPVTIERVGMDRGLNQNAPAAAQNFEAQEQLRHAQASWSGHVEACEEATTVKPMVKIASTLSCQRFKIVGRDLTNKSVPFEMVDVTDPANRDFAEHVKELGYREAPVVVAQRPIPGVPAHWGGVRPDLHQVLAATAAAARTPTGLEASSP